MRNFSLLTLILAAFALCSAGNVRPASALIVEEGYEQTGGGLLDSIREYVFLNFGAFSTPTGDSQRHLIIGSGGVDFSTDKFQVYVEGRAWKEQVELRQERLGGANASLPPTRSLKVESDEVEVNEAYVSVAPHPRLTLKAGRSKVVWGQFDVFSPVFFNLPFTTKNIGTTFSKVNYALSQNIAQVTVLPHERIEIQGYFFLKTIVDPLIADVVREEYDIKRDDLQDHNQYAARVLFYPDWATIGLTYLHGRSTFAVEEMQSLVRAPMTGMCPGGDNENRFSLDSDDYCLTNSPGLPKLDMFAVEATFPVGRWIFKTEGAYRITEGGVRDLSIYSIMQSAPDSNTGRYIREAISRNNGRFFGDVREIIGGAGVEYVADKWRVEAAGFAYYQAYSGVAEDLSAVAEGGEADTELQAAPFLNATYFISEDKKSFIGLTGGFLGSVAAGVSLYAVWNIERFDHLGAGILQLTAGLDYLQYLSDSQLSELTDNNDYDFNEDFTLAPRVGLVWKF